MFKDLKEVPKYFKVGNHECELVVMVSIWAYIISYII